jgi:glycolate oxidase iron-sulfur subunit
LETHLADFVKDTAAGREADAILRTCVHCGFCTATCPTYQLLGDELDGPRGRIYLIKQMLEGGTVTAKTQLHLDRCLTCRACETTCPSGVRYGRLADIGRHLIEERVPRPSQQRALRWLLRKALLSRSFLALGIATGRAARPFLPRAIERKLPRRRRAAAWPAPQHSRRMLALHGCVQPALAPSIDAALARVLDRVGISLVRVTGTGCCGALSHHLAAPAEAVRLMRANIDAWWPHIDQGAEAIVVSASGCGVFVKEYADLLGDDPVYGERAQRIGALARDPVEIIGAEWERLAPLLTQDRTVQRIVFHAPCTLQHGLKLTGRVEEILLRLGIEPIPVADAHLCCGSAGTYSILQPELAEELRANKLRALEAHAPDVIATANIGCLLHLAAGTARPVRHWIELLDERLASGV